jgi:hypothetical protein
MRRVFGWTLVGGLLLAAASTASAQVSGTFFNPYAGTGVTLGGYGGTPGYAYGNPSQGSPINTAPYANPAPGYGSGYPGTYGVAPGTPGYAYGNPSYGSPINTTPGYGTGAGFGYPGTYANPGYGSAYPSAPYSGYNSAYSGYTYPGTTSYSYRSYSSGYGPTYRYPSYGFNSPGYAYPSYGPGRGTFLIRIR